MDIFSQIGAQEILMILLVAVIVIGPAKIVEFGKTVGKITRHIKQASTSLTRELEEEANKNTGAAQSGTKKP